MIGFTGAATPLQSGPRGETMEKAIRRAVIAGTLALLSAEHSTLAQLAKNSRQQQKPSLEETEQWIAQTFTDGKHYGPNFANYAIQVIHFDNSSKSDETQCYMYFSVFNGDMNSVLDSYWRREENVRFMQLVDLAEIDPTSIRAIELNHDSDSTTTKNSISAENSLSVAKDEPYVFLSIKTANEKDSIIQHTYLKEDGKSKTSQSMEHVVGFFPNGIAVKAEYAPRFIKALRHAVELCGGKPSIY